MPLEPPASILRGEKRHFMMHRLPSFNSEEKTAYTNHTPYLNPYSAPCPFYPNICKNYIHVKEGAKKGTYERIPTYLPTNELPTAPSSFSP